MSCDSKLITTLRQRTSAGLLACRSALEEAHGDLEQAVLILRKRGEAKVLRASTEPTEGQVFAYLHHNGRIGVLLDLACQTDFAARTPEFIQLGADLSLHIAAADPRCVTIEQLPPELVAAEREVHLAGITNKPPQIVEKIVAGRLKKFYAEAVLMEQAYVKEPAITVAQLINRVTSVLKEPVAVRRFVRYTI